MRALKGVAVQVGDRRDADRAALVAGAGGSADLDRGDRRRSSIVTRTSDAQPSGSQRASRMNDRATLCSMPSRRACLIARICLYIYEPWRKAQEATVRGQTTPMRGRRRLWRNARLATLAPSAAGLGVVERGALAVARPAASSSPARERTSPAAWRATRAHRRLRGSLDHAGPDRLPHPSRLRRRPGARIRAAARAARATKRSRAPAAASLFDRARDARGERGRPASARRCRVSTR